VEMQMQKDDETTAYQLHKLLMEKGYLMSLSTVFCCHVQLGWTFRGSASYCQLIREANKAKRLAWCQKYLNEAENGFQNVIWTDESSIMETHKRYCHRKDGQAAKS